MSGSFAEVADADLDRLIREMPLCWVVPHGTPDSAILMPVVLRRASGAVSLLGHLPRRAPAVAALTRAPVASFLFLGANGYVSPQMAGARDWAPTWNFVSARLTGLVAIDPALTREAVEAIVASMEGEHGWTLAEIGARADTLIARIVGFRAQIDTTVPRFKLGQDEPPEVFETIFQGCAGTPLGAWMEDIREA